MVGLNSSVSVSVLNVHRLCTLKDKDFQTGLKLNILPPNISIQKE